MQRRRMLCALACAPAATLANRRPQAAEADLALPLQHRQALLAAAEAALAAGNVDVAERSLDEAASSEHAPDIEMALVRTYMQAGSYRRALAFAAHAAGAHVDEPAATALYAWLLAVGGQRDVALHLLARASGDPTVDEVRRSLRERTPSASARLLELPHRMAPYSVPQGVAASARDGDRVIANGTLLADGKTAIVPLECVAPALTVRVRNGMGVTVQARADVKFESIGMATVRLDRPLEGGVPFCRRDPFAGSPGYTASYPVDVVGAPAWPWLCIGFLGAAGKYGRRVLAFDSPMTSPGAPVFDVRGEVAGIVSAATTEPAAWIPVSSLHAIAAVAESAGAVAAVRPAPDAIYERALGCSLQVIA